MAGCFIFIIVIIVVVAAFILIPVVSIAAEFGASRSLDVRLLPPEPMFVVTAATVVRTFGGLAFEFGVGELDSQVVRLASS